MKVASETVFVATFTVQDISETVAWLDYRWTDSSFAYRNESDDEEYQIKDEH